MKPKQRQTLTNQVLERHATSADPHARLWLAVVQQAVTDLQLAKYRHAALMFLRRDNPGFINACTNADLDPGYVLKLVALSGLLQAQAA